MVIKHIPALSYKHFRRSTVWYLCTRIALPYPNWRKKMRWRKGKIPLPRWQVAQWLHFQAGAGQLVEPVSNRAQVLPQPERVRVWRGDGSPLPGLPAKSWALRVSLFDKGRRNTANRIPQNYIYVVHLSSHCNIHIVHFVTSISNNFEYIFTV